MSFLKLIVEKKREEVEEAKRRRPLSEIKEILKDRPPALDFRSALKKRRCAIIAEVKRSSPSKGRMVELFKPVEIAALYEAHGAAAVSVLTEKNFFEGSSDFLSRIKQAVRVPVLRKDFIFDPYQIYESRALGADALLLIAGLLSEERLRDFICLANALGVAQLIEVHDRGELEMALATGAGLIGINNRDLKSFLTDLRTTVNLASEVPPSKLVISESGIRTRADVERLMRAGVHAFLIGEELIRADDIGEKLRELLGDDRD